MAALQWKNLSPRVCSWLPFSGKIFLPIVFIASDEIRPATVYKGEAAVLVSREDTDRLATPFRWALVGKFSHGRPTLKDIRKFFAALNLRDHVSVGLMDYRHVLIKCVAEADFNRIWTKGIWQLGKFSMRVFRWTRESHMHKESSLVPVWMALPALPIHYFGKHSLFSILSLVGRPLFLDSAMAAGTCPSVARVCVEVDEAKPVVSRICVAVEGEIGSWQRIVAEDMPWYCSFCWRLGHSLDECKKSSFELHLGQNNRNLRMHDPQIYVPVSNPIVNGARTLMFYRLYLSRMRHQLALMILKKGQ
ncbi:uncharacterized protein [Coffea arabica]|uniref:DUF4283 domain-containing protein n=1 Tax=Coffea arabica TaxID=13443 RepID=A0A6P6S985_COFAR|nr:uncharacterized protein LOC113688424 [Coffea arabica]